MNYRNSNTQILLHAARQYQLSPIIMLKLDRALRTVTDEATGRVVTLPHSWDLS